jgi:hypothetical protein
MIFAFPALIGPGASKKTTEFIPKIQDYPQKKGSCDHEN